MYYSVVVDVHDDVIKWKHFPRNWPFVREIHRSPVNCPHKGQWRGALMFSLIYAWINDWVNNREAGDLRRQHGHYDVIVMPSNSRCHGIGQVIPGYPALSTRKVKLYIQMNSIVKIWSWLDSDTIKWMYRNAWISTFRYLKNLRNMLEFYLGNSQLNPYSARGSYFLQTWINNACESEIKFLWNSSGHGVEMWIKHFYRWNTCQ